MASTNKATTKTNAAKKAPLPKLKKAFKGKDQPQALTAPTTAKVKEPKVKHLFAVGDRAAHGMLGEGTIVKLEKYAGNVLIKFDKVTAEHLANNDKSYKFSGVNQSELTFVMSAKDWKKTLANRKDFAVGDTISSIHPMEKSIKLKATIVVRDNNGRTMNLKYEDGTLANGVIVDHTWTLVKKAKKAKPLGDAREQNKGYAKLAAKLKLGTTVVELGGEKREGHVVVEANEGSGFVDVQFPGGKGPLTKHVADLRVTKKAPTPVFTKGDRVSHPAHGEGTVFAAIGTPGMFNVITDKDQAESDARNEPDVAVTEIHQDELTLLMTAKDVAKAARPVKLKFDDVNLFGAFISKDKTFVKVSKSNGIAVMIRGTADEPFAMLATPTTKINSSAIQRFKKTDKVSPFVAPVSSH